MSERVPYPSLEAMLEPAELGRIIGRRVEEVVVEPVVGAETSTEATFLTVSLDGEPRPSLHIKRVDPATDWVALITEDRSRRAVTLWTHGVLARMPGELDPAVIACASWDEGYAVLMPDIGSELTPRWISLTQRQSDAVLDAMAAMHATFWEDQRLAEPDLGLCPAELFLSHTSPGKAAAMKRRLGSFVFDAMEEGWDLLPRYMDPGLVHELRELNDEPSSIVAALERTPKTLVHSDIRPANMGIRDAVTDGAAVVLIDWGRPVHTAPTIDLGYYLGWTAVERPVDVDEAIARYEARLRHRLGARIEGPRWESQRDIGILGGVLNTICFHAFDAGRDDEIGAIERDALAWWSVRLSETLRLL